MSEPKFLTTREVAELLRLGERKVYDLASNDELPVSRVGGKLRRSHGSSFGRSCGGFRH